MNTPRTRCDALTFLKRHHTGVIATVDQNTIPHASTVHYWVDDNFNIYFVTLPSSRKYKALTAHPHVAFTVTREDTPQTVQIEGIAKDVTLDSDAQKKKGQIMAIMDTNPFFFAPITKLDPEKKVVIVIQPTWIRWADYAFSKYGTARVFKEVQMA